MPVYKLKSNPSYYFIDGHVTINKKRYHYSSQSTKDDNYKKLKWCKEKEKELIHETKRKHLSLGLDSKVYKLKDLLCDYVVKMKVDGRKDGTIKAFKLQYKNYFKDFFNEDSFVEECFNEENVLNFKGFIKDKELSTDYKNQILNSLGRLINFAARKKRISYETEKTLLDYLDPFKNIDPKSTLHKFTPLKDARKVWENASNEYFKYIFEFLYYSGCRISEFLGIEARDVKFIENSNDVLAVIQISKQLFNLKDGPVPYLKNQSSNRTIYFVGDVAKHFKEYIEKTGFKDDALLFPLSKNHLRRELNKAFDKANVEHNTFHGFGRKSIATQLYLIYKDAKLVQLLLGHKNVDMTLNTYILGDSLKGELVNKLKNLENYDESSG